MRDPFLAGVLSLLIPGVGQLYNGRILAGILWLLLTPGFWIGTGGTLGWVCHIIAGFTALFYAKKPPVGEQDGFNHRQQRERWVAYKEHPSLLFLDLRRA